jgi:hypothetical protein
MKRAMMGRNNLSVPFGLNSIRMTRRAPRMIVAMPYRVDEYSQPHVAKAVATPAP